MTGGVGDPDYGRLNPSLLDVRLEVSLTALGEWRTSIDEPTLGL